MRGSSAVVVREFSPERDRRGAEVVEELCELGPKGKVALFTHLRHPASRVSHSPCHLMLVAETVNGGSEKEIVGLIRGCVKTATCGKELRSDEVATPVVTKLAYILGLRVHPAHRRMGIAMMLVSRMEEWFRQQGAEYAYMATDKENEASVRLFTERCSYSKFRTPAILVQPVFAHRLRRGGDGVDVVEISPSDAEILYRPKFSSTEFFPGDIDDILHSPLSVGTFIAIHRGYQWDGADAFVSDPPESWAAISVWDCNEVFRMEIRGVSKLLKLLARASRIADRAMPWLSIPSFPDLFRPFGIYFLYGVCGEGPRAAALLRALCAHAHNLARTGGCAVVATEVAANEPLRAGIPHWRRLSFADDLWCLKHLAGNDDGHPGVDWTKSLPPPSIFVDPREV